MLRKVRAVFTRVAKSRWHGGMMYLHGEFDCELDNVGGQLHDATDGAADNLDR